MRAGGCCENVLVCLHIEVLEHFLLLLCSYLLMRLRTLPTTQAQSPMEWASTSSKVKRTFVGLQKRRKGRISGPEDDVEDRIIASIAAGLSNMPEENQVSSRCYRAFWQIPPRSG